MNVLVDAIKPFKELPVKNCRECRFSDGGQLFACTYNNAIQIYRTYTCEQIQKLSGHNGKVQSLCWADFDTKLLSAGTLRASPLQTFLSNWTESLRLNMNISVQFNRTPPSKYEYLCPI